MNAIELALGTGPIVKFVLFLLVGASLLSWFVIAFKWMFFKKVNSENETFLHMFWKGSPLDEVYSESKDYKLSSIASVFRSGYNEFRKVIKKDKSALNKYMVNIERSLRKSAMEEVLRLEKKVPILASIASVAPFIGLFGTVWGIMNSFQGLAQGGPATLQRVAPGISEALIATAVGLAAAIPAVIFYNIYINKIRTLRVEMDNFSSDFTNILQRNSSKSNT